MKIRSFPSSSGLLALAVLAGACTTVDPNQPRDANAVREEKVPVFADHTKESLPRRWTERFADQAILIGVEVEIEGPADLLQHLAVQQDEAVFDYATWTTRDGLRQEISLKPGVGGREIRAQLDGWTIVALKRLRVLQRPGDSPVDVVATGEAAYLPVGDATGEQRAARLSFRGEHVR